MRLLCLIIAIISLASSGLGQVSPAYQRGTIMAVQRHMPTPGETTNSAQYEVAVQVGNVRYVVLYTPPKGANSVEYAAGRDLLVLVGDHTLTFPSKLSGTTEVPILRREALQGKSGIDWSKAPSQYFTMKMQNLSDSLDLNDEQRAKLKPIAEQEAGEAGQVCFTSVVPRQERLKRWEKIVRSSDEKMKSFLSRAQWQKLQELRKEQKQELKDLIARSDDKQMP